MKNQRTNNEYYATMLLFGFIFLYLLSKNIGLYPTVFSDEYNYSKLARLTPLSEASVPSYLYLSIFSITNYCGDSFLVCARLINVVLFTSAAPFIYYISKSVASPSISTFVTLLAVLGPINSYTAYFMPESSYFLAFWVFSWCLLNLTSQSGKYEWLIAGAVFGISSLVKPHSILFLPAIFIYISFLFFLNRPLSYKKLSIAVFAFNLGAIAVKFGVSYLLAGTSGLTVFGPVYSSIASSAATGVDKYIQLYQFALENIKGHVLILSLIYGLPFILVITLTIGALFKLNHYQIRAETTVSQLFILEKVSLFSLIIILNLVCVTSIFTASVVNLGSYETPYRFHMRYYNFALPLFYIVTAGVFSKVISINSFTRNLVGAMVLLLGVFAIWSNLAPYTPNFVDGPEIRGLHVDRLYYLVVGGLLISSITLWLFSQRNGLRLYLYLALPSFVFVSTLHIGSEQRNRLVQDVYDKAGIFTKQYLTNEDISKTVIIGSEAGGLYRSLFYLDNAKASLEVIQRGADYDLAKLPAGKEWVLVVGDHELLGKPLYQNSLSGFTLVRASGGNVLDFKKGAWPGIIRKVKGLSTAEFWGTWSQSNIVTFEFAGPLPSKFEIHLIASAYGPYVDKEFEASVGDDSAKFRLSANSQQKIIILNNQKGSNALRFKIPNVVSPKPLGLSGDDRYLGIAFVEMKIVTIN